MKIGIKYTIGAASTESSEKRVVPHPVAVIKLGLPSANGRGEKATQSKLAARIALVQNPH